MAKIYLGVKHNFLLKKCTIFWYEGEKCSTLLGQPLYLIRSDIHESFWPDDVCTIWILINNPKNRVLIKYYQKLVDVIWKIINPWEQLQQHSENRVHPFCFFWVFQYSKPRLHVIVLSLADFVIRICNLNIHRKQKNITCRSKEPNICNIHHAVRKLSTAAPGAALWQSQK